MPSTFAWLDSSESDRRRALEVLDLFQLRESRDELGIAGVRDTIADLLSPGTSTIQTRARYFLFIPWIYAQIAGGAPPRSWDEEMRKRETQLMRELAAQEKVDVIGRRAGAEVKRLPSEIYWAGLGVLGIRRFDGSRDGFHRQLSRNGNRAVRDDEMDREGAAETGWHSHIPSAPAGFPNGADFRLTPAEATYLRDRIRQSGPRSLLCLLADGSGPWIDAELPWHHPEAQRAAPSLARVLHHARCFSEVMHGAAILYNQMLCELISQPDWDSGYENLHAAWATMIERRRGPLRDWDRNDFWNLIREHNSGVPLPTASFIDRWIELTLGTEARAIPRSESARLLVRRREIALKGKRSRFESRAHREQWNGSSGAGQIDFRWRITRSIAADIRNGLAPDRPIVEDG